MFIEAFDVEAARHAVKGFVTVRDKQPQFIAPTEYVGILSSRPLSSTRIEIGQWVRCLAGRYRNNVGYVYKTDISSEWNVVVVFVPRIPQLGGKQKRDGRPTPRVWSAEELAQLYGNRKVKVLRPNKFVFGRSTYEDGLAMEHTPLSYLRVLEHSPQNITPFVQSAMIRSHPAFYPCLRRFVQDSTQVGDRILVISGEHAGIIGRTKTIQDNVADVVTQSPEQHSGLVICVSLRDLIPHFLPGDNVKDRWTDSFGMVVTIDHNEQKVTFLDRDANAEVCLLPFPPSLIDPWPHRSIRQHSTFSSSVLPFGFSDSLPVSMLNSLAQVVRRVGVAYHEYLTAVSPKSWMK